MHCHLVSLDRIPLGEKALRLFIADDELNAGIIEHRCDGRFVVTDGPLAGIAGIVPTISVLLNRHSEHLYVVLEPDAYWPEMFPKILPLDG